MGTNRGRVGTLTLCMFVLLLGVFTPTSSAQSEVDYKDYGNIDGGGSAQGGGSCSFCDEPQCGCDPGTFSIGIELVGWWCACDNSQPHGICAQTCYYR
jgi:hypothetical protein